MTAAAGRAVIMAESARDIIKINARFHSAETGVFNYYKNVKYSDICFKFIGKCGIMCYTYFLEGKNAVEK